MSGQTVTKTGHGHGRTPALLLANLIMLGQTKTRPILVILAFLAALEGLLERLRLVLGRLEGILDRLGGILGVLEGSWRRLGASWRRLGAS